MANSQGSPLKSFIRDLRHKSIWQVLGTYLLASWGVLAVVDTMAGALNLPDWFPTVALGFLVLGKSLNPHGDAPNRSRSTACPHWAARGMSMVA